MSLTSSLSLLSELLWSLRVTLRGYSFPLNISPSPSVRRLSGKDFPGFLSYPHRRDIASPLRGASQAYAVGL